MINIVITVFTVLDVIIAVLLVLLILVQQSKDGGFGSAFGGMGESVFGVQATSHLAKLTVIFAGAFLFITLLLAVVTGHRDASNKKALEKAATMLESAGEKTVDKTTTPVDMKDKKDTAASPAGTVSVGPVAETKKTEKGGEVTDDGTITKKDSGDTITPVAQPDNKDKAADLGTTTVTPPETVTVKPVEQPQPPPAENKSSQP